jgi:hypothetical protein
MVIVVSSLATPRAINWQASGPPALPVAESSENSDGRIEETRMSNC